MLLDSVAIGLPLGGNKGPLQPRVASGRLGRTDGVAFDHLKAPLKSGEIAQIICNYKLPPLTPSNLCHCRILSA